MISLSGETVGRLTQNNYQYPDTKVSLKLFSISVSVSVYVSVLIPASVFVFLSRASTPSLTPLQPLPPQTRDTDKRAGVITIVDCLQAEGEMSLSENSESTATVAHFTAHTNCTVAAISFDRR